MRKLMKLNNLNIVCSQAELGHIPEGKVLINTINAHSYNTAQRDEAFAEALSKGDYGTRRLLKLSARGIT